MRKIILAALSALSLSAQPITNAQTHGERMAAEYFRRQTARIAARTLADVHTLADWQARRATYRQQLLEMLGLSPLPARGDLKATLTGKVETEKFTVEKIHFQSLPGLYVTANLYLPKKLDGLAPAVLYLCGHLRTVKDGIAYGTKVGYRHHLITEGPHSDTQDLQVPAFRWLNRWLKKDTGLLSEPALKRFEIEQLKVFTSLPADQINTRIHDTFVPAAPPAALPSTRQEWQSLAARWSAALREKIFNNWPETDPRPAVKVLSDLTHNGARARLVEFQPDDAYRLQLALLTHARQTPTKLAVSVLDEEQLRRWAAVGGRYFPDLFASENNDGAAEADWLKPLQEGTAIALVLPRGVGPTAWRKEKDIHIRRRFLLLGQSLETMQVWDTRAALSALRSFPPLDRLPVTLRGARTMSVVALFAALFEDSVKSLELERLPSTLANGPSFPNALRFFDLPQLVAMALPRSVNLTGADPGDWEWSLKTAKLMEGTISVR
ncbi:MAG TPA: hypothetical protein VJ810_01920 [Blastocatellia bacterium]|nr:hypothetical protein [Blastocatellia bacterium]